MRTDAWDLPSHDRGIRPFRASPARRPRPSLRPALPALARPTKTGAILVPRSRGMLRVSARLGHAATVLCNRLKVGWMTLRSFSPAVSLPTAKDFPAGPHRRRNSKCLTERDLSTKSAIDVQSEIDVSRVFPAGRERRHGFAAAPRGGYSTVTLFARLRGWSTSVPLITATW